MKVKLDMGAVAPKQAHDTDAGYDLCSMVSEIIPSHGSAVFDTGVHMEIPKGYAGLLVSKSGLNVNHGITSTGLIDESYTGSIKAKLYNHSDRDYPVHKGDKITQIMIVPVMHLPIEIVDELEDTERGDCGFGSTGP